MCVCVSDGRSDDSIPFKILIACALSIFLMSFATGVWTVTPFISSSITLLEKGEAVFDFRGRFLTVCGFTDEEDELEEEEEEVVDVSLDLSRFIVAGKWDDLKPSVLSPLQSFFNCKK